MKFSLDAISKFSGRAGSFVQCEGNVKFLTPLLLQTTKCGSIPYMTKEVFDFVSSDKHILEICLASTEKMEEALVQYKKGIASYVGYPNSPTLVCLKEPTEQVSLGYDTTKDTVPVLTRRGKKLISAERYMNIIEAFQPTFYCLLSDSDTNEESSAKRALKAVEKTTSFTSACLKRHRESKTLGNSFVIGPIVGAFNKEARTKSVKSIIDAPEIGGFTIEGLHSNGCSTLNINRELLNDIVSHCIEQLPEEKPKFMLGPYDPVQILELVRLGIDVFDTSYPYLATMDFRALTFNSNLDDSNDSNLYCIDLKESKYKDQFAPFLTGCQCLACTKYTRAYVNHLYITKELLAPMLLMIHNLHHYMKFFENIQKAVLADRLPELIALIKEQKVKQKALEKENTDKDSVQTQKPQDKITKSVKEAVMESVANTDCK